MVLKQLMLKAKKLVAITRDKTILFKKMTTFSEQDFFFKYKLVLLIKIFKLLIFKKPNLIFLLKLFTSHDISVIIK